MSEHQRPLWIIIFAILLASIAIRTKGADPVGAERIGANHQVPPNAVSGSWLGRSVRAGSDALRQAYRER